MPHLPTELWLLIASYCDPKDLWLNLRQVNRQLSECAEQHFQRELLSQVTLSLAVAIPTYDMRSQTRGKAVFVQDELDVLHKIQHISYSLSETVPEHYFNHFLARWKGMCESKGLSDRIEWQMGLGWRNDTVRLRNPSANATRHDTSDYANVSFDWKPSMTSFFRHSSR